MGYSLDNASSQSIEAADSASLRQPSAAFGFRLWMRVPDFDGNGNTGPMYKQRTGFGLSHAFRKTTDRVYRLSLQISGVTEETAVSAQVPSGEGLYCYGGWISGGALQAVIKDADGNVIETLTSAGTASGTIDYDSQPLKIGADPFGFWTGDVAELAIYDYYDQAELESLQFSSAPDTNAVVHLQLQSDTNPEPDSSGNGNDGTLLNSPTFIAWPDLGGGDFSAAIAAGVSPFTTAIAAQLSFSAAASVALASFGASNQSSEEFSGAADPAAAPYAASGSGALGFAGGVSGALAPFTATASASEAFSGTAEPDAPRFGLSSAALERFLASGTVAAQPYACTAAATQSRSCAASVAAAPFGVSATAATSSSDHVAGTAPAAAPFGVQGSAALSYSCSAALSTESFALAASAIVDLGTSSLLVTATATHGRAHDTGVDSARVYDTTVTIQ